MVQERSRALKDGSFSHGCFLSLIQHSSSQPGFKINIWILKDHVNKSWMKTPAAVDIGVFVPGFALRWAEHVAVYFVAVDGKILFRRVGRYRLFAYNLKLGTIRMFMGKGMRLFMGKASSL